ncbi:GNAT family N-acetyltransferase [Patescibacteria group bacterium]|nr:GNAT family N-acetyltransferase [Patescibacteria group bacterium]
MNEVNIRELEFEDLIKVFRLGEAVFTADNWPILYRTWDEYEILDRFLSDSEHCFVAEDEKGKIIGFVLGSVIRKKKSAWVYGYINWIAIKKDSQCKGLGKRLCMFLIRRLKKAGVNMLMIDTSPDNEKAINFFRKLGFSGREEHVYMFRNLTKKS